MLKVETFKSSKKKPQALNLPMSFSYQFWWLNSCINPFFFPLLRCSVKDLHKQKEPSRTLIARHLLIVLIYT